MVAVLVLCAATRHGSLGKFLTLQCQFMRSNFNIQEHVIAILDVPNSRSLHS